MVGFDRGNRRVLLLLAGVGFAIVVMNLSMLSGNDIKSKIKQIPLAGKSENASPGLNAPPDPNVYQCPSHIFYEDNHLLT
jgi:hypothetical protein